MRIQWVSFNTAVDRHTLLIHDTVGFIQHHGQACSTRFSGCQLTPRHCFDSSTLGFCMVYVEVDSRLRSWIFLARPRAKPILKLVAKKNRFQTKQNLIDKKIQTILTETSVNIAPFGYISTKQAKQTYCFACFVLNVWRTAFSTGRLGRSKNDFSHKYRNSS